MGDPDADTKPFSSNNGRSHPTKKVLKHQRRESLLGGGDSTTTTTATTTGTTTTPSRRGVHPSTKKDKEVMAASFLQFCAMCEKQIMTPCNSLLYCSEACRRKDSAKPLSACTLALPSPPRPASAPSLRIPADQHGYKSDLDPTEWKPKLGNSDRRKTSSEAFRYLSRFHQSMTMTNSNATNISDTPIGNDKNNDTNTSVVQYNPTNTTPGLSLNTTPAMTPTTASASSSFASSSSSNSNPFPSHSTPNSYIDGYDYDYTFTLRPLPPRQNPLYYSSSAGGFGGGRGGRKGIDLVTPHIVPSSSISGTTEGSGAFFPATVYDHDFWGKKTLKKEHVGTAEMPTTAPRSSSSSSDLKNPGEDQIHQVDGLGALFGRNLKA